MNRFDSEGRNIGRDYQLACIKSWISCGFDVCSVNSRQEHLPSYLTDLVHVESVERDASSLTGKALPFVSDVFSIAEKMCEGRPFIFVNADIFLGTGSTALCDAVRNLKPQQCLVERRYDVPDLQALGSASAYMDGYDVFAFTPDDAKRLLLEGFVIGMPWWDLAIAVGSIFRICSASSWINPRAFICCMNSGGTKGS